MPCHGETAGNNLQCSARSCAPNGSMRCFGTDCLLHVIDGHCTATLTEVQIQIDLKFRHCCRLQQWKEASLIRNELSFASPEADNADARLWKTLLVK